MPARHWVVDRKRLYLQPGDPVRHITQRSWGVGVAVECATSTLPGGTCLVRVRFMDGRLRCFENNLDNPSCAHYFGLRHYYDEDTPYTDEPRRRRAAPPAIPSALLHALAAPERARALAAPGENDGDAEADEDDTSALTAGQRWAALVPPRRLVPEPPRQGGPMIVEARADRAERLTNRRKRP